MVYQLQNPALVQQKPSTHKPLVNLLLATDQNYISFTGLAVATFLKHLNPNFFLNVVILHDGSVAQGEMEKLGKIRNPNNVENHIVFLDCRNELPLMNEREMTIPRSMMYRLLLPIIMQHFDRVLYVDSDIMAAGDVSPLFTMPMGDCAIAAVRDLPVYANCKLGIKVPVKSYMTALVANNEQNDTMAWRDYFKKYLGMEENWGDYFNSGVILFDIKKILSLDVLDNILIDVGRGYVYPDQDILNKYLAKHCLQLPPIWNLHAFLKTPLFDGHIKNNVPQDLVTEYVAACDNPRIIHFAGPWKPWKRGDIIHTDKFFNNLVETPWFDEMMNKYQLNKMYKIEVKQI